MSFTPQKPVFGQPNKHCAKCAFEFTNQNQLKWVDGQVVCRALYACKIRAELSVAGLPSNQVLNTPTHTP